MWYLVYLLHFKMEKKLQPKSTQAKSSYFIVTKVIAKVRYPSSCVKYAIQIRRFKNILSFRLNGNALLFKKHNCHGTRNTYLFLFIAYWSDRVMPLCSNHSCSSVWNTKFIWNSAKITFAGKLARSRDVGLFKKITLMLSCLVCYVVSIVEKRSIQFVVHVAKLFYPESTIKP